MIRLVGSSHATYRIRIRRASHAAVLPASGDQPAQRHPLPKTRTVKPAGASRGIGRAIAVELDRSPTLVVNDERSPEAAAEVVTANTVASGKTWSL